MSSIAEIIFDFDFESTVFNFLFGKRPLVKQENDNFVKH